ncbi:MAG: glucose-1-phosphate cytidylyltransferase [Alphaproteobacteria bacterium]|nr:glucose-1-phosphate cytidylyltransferase [Alphaproteobacteria bacterium]
MTVKAVILAGGRGSRIGEETHLRPKPMIEIGGRPILWHIMKIYAHHGITDFIVCLGYRGFMIKEWFANYVLHAADVTVDLAQNRIEYHDRRTEPWRVTLVDTGADTQTGGRVKRIAHHLDRAEPFCLTYGDGVADIDIAAELAFHRRHGRLATMAVVAPPARFGRATITGERVIAFAEKSEAAGHLINGGFFVVSPPALDRIGDDDTVWERGPLEGLARDGQLASWRHDGFWLPMDTMRDKDHLEELWRSQKAPWKVWA